MKPRYHTSGNDKHWATPAYRYRMSVPGPIVTRPEGEPSLLMGALIVLGCFVLVAIIAGVLP